jgi:hypothetical protein
MAGKPAAPLKPQEKRNRTVSGMKSGKKFFFLFLWPKKARACVLASQYFIFAI